MTTKRRDNWISDLKRSEDGLRVLERERVWVEATENICRLMDTEQVSRAELARRLDVSRATVTQMLSGERNLTLGTLADAFFVLGRSLHVTYGPLTDRVQVMETFTEASVIPNLEVWKSGLEQPEGAAWQVSAPGSDDPFKPNGEMAA